MTWSHIQIHWHEIDRCRFEWTDTAAQEELEDLDDLKDWGAPKGAKRKPKPKPYAPPKLSDQNRMKRDQKTIQKLKKIIKFRR
jgi:hypothetical protein